jgi:hypothetical protein
MEYRILQRAMNHHDFFEGARAGMLFSMNIIIHFLLFLKFSLIKIINLDGNRIH